MILVYSFSLASLAYSEPTSLPVPVVKWPPATIVETLSLNNSQAAASLMLQKDYTLDQVRASGAVPPLFALNLPTDLAKQPVDQKTRVFIRLILPNIVKVNEDVLAVRQDVLELDHIQKQGQSLSTAQQQWLAKVASNYGLETPEISALLIRVDAVPVALALAQGIDESGWGTSHFAKAGNVLYGQHAAAGSQQKTLTTPDGKVEVAAFDSLFQATASYIHNLNSSHAYAGLRQVRSQLRAAGKPVTAYELAGSLLHYSARGEGYVQDLRGIINHRHLDKLDKLKMADAPAIAIEFNR